MDEIFLVNSCSFQNVDISASLKAAPNVTVDFTQAATVTGSFSGDASELTHVSASYIVPEANATASYALTSSFALNAAGNSNSSSWASSSISASYAETASYVNPLAFDNLVLAFEFKFSTDTSATDPTSGDFKYDNAASASISNVYISYQTNNGLDISGIIESLHSGSYNLYIQQKSDANKASIFQVTNEVIDSGSWFAVPVSMLSTTPGGLPSNNQLCAIFVINKNAIVPGQTYPITSSWANNAVSASYATTASNSVTSSWCLSGSYFSFVNVDITQSYTFLTSSISSSWASSSIISISSSWASSSISASYAPDITSYTSSLLGTASWAEWATNAVNGGTTLITASTYPITASWSISSSWSPIQISISASWATQSLSASYSPVEPAYSASISTQFGTKQATITTGSTLPITASWAVTASYVSALFSRGGTIYDALGIAGTAATASNVIVWRAPYSCSVNNVWGYRVTGSSALVNARKNGTGTIATGSHISLTSVDTWISASSITATSFAAGDKLEIMLISSSAYPTQIAVQVDFTK
jgi:hypothetical protein